MKEKPGARNEIPKWMKNAFRCDGCGVNVHDTDEYAYILDNAIWRQAIKSKRLPRRPRLHGKARTLCVACVETALDRRLGIADFDPLAPINFLPDFPRSRRLRTRQRDLIRLARLLLATSRMADRMIERAKRDFFQRVQQASQT